MTFDLAGMIAKLRDPELIVSRTDAADTLEHAKAEITRLTAERDEFKGYADRTAPLARTLIKDMAAEQSEIIRLTARVEWLEGALGAIVDLTTIPDSEFEAKHPELNTMLDGECLQNWHEVVAQFAHNKLNNASAALSTPTEEPKT